MPTYNCFGSFEEHLPIYPKKNLAQKHCLRQSGSKCQVIRPFLHRIIGKEQATEVFLN